MTKAETKKAIKVMQAYCDGAEIEWALEDEMNDEDFRRVGAPVWNWHDKKYRVKKKGDK